MSRSISSKSSSYADAFIRLYDILQVLRGPDGCPWDRAQTIDTFCKNILEEAYEYIDAVSHEQLSNSHEELGDLFLVITMLAQMHEVRDDLTLQEIFDGISDKLIRRHPHVFSTETAENPEEVLTLWDSIKEEVEGKKPDADDFFNHLPKAMPPLDRAEKIQKKAQKAGFDWDGTAGIFDKLQEEIRELKEAAAQEDYKRIEDELGDVLFTVVNIARFLNVPSSIALHRTNEKFMKRFNAMRMKLTGEGLSLSGEHMDTMERYWQEAKDED